jgi:creatinine amidohydrolase
MSVLWENMSWDEIKAKINEHTVAILPCGATEQHSIHLPVGSDTQFVYKVSQLAAEKASEKADVLVLPPVYFGRSPEESNFPGTLYLKLDTYVRLIEDLCEDVIHFGIKRIILYSGHGNNPPLLNEIAKEMRTKYNDVFIGVLPPLQLVLKDINEIVESKFWGHACEIETSMMMYTFPELVKKEKFKKPDVNVYSITDINSVEGSLYLPWRVEDFSDTGAFGDPTKASFEKGKIITDKAVERLSDLIVEFSKWDRSKMKPLQI